MFVKSNILRSPHAFATRRGGVSKLEHTKSLNLALGRGDDDETVLKNLDIFAREVGFERESIVSLPQIHSDRIFTVTKEMCGQGYFIRDGIESSDGYVTAEKGVTLGIKTADCTPILLEAEKDSEIIAIGAVHAGWRGTVADIVGKCVERLVSELGAESQSIRAAIGPCIHKCCYEVSEDIYCEVAKGLSDDMARRFVLPSKEVEGKFYCDLVGINRELLISHGLCDENIDVIDECTCCIPEKYFSHRYSNGHRGTMLNVIFME